MQVSPRIQIFGIATSVALLGLAGCDKGGAAAGAPTTRPTADPVPVLVAVAAQQDVPLQVQAIGWGESYASVRVKSRVDGNLTEVCFKEGDNVKIGDHLFTIDPRPFDVAVHLAEANLARDQAVADDAQADFKWVESLYKENTATEREYGRGKAKFDAALATVHADQAALDEAKLNLAYCTITSPIDGKLGEHLVDQGNMVKANDTMLLNIEQLSPLFVTFSVAEQYLATIKQYMRETELRVDAAIPDEGTPAEAGVLSFLDNKVDMTTGTVRLKATFKNENRRLWPGQYVNVTLNLTLRKGQVVVPAQAVQTGQKGQFVYVVKSDDTAEIRPVRPGDMIANRIIISAGLSAGEMVVTDGQLRLTNGAKVQIKNPASQSVENVAAKEGRS
jgi:membrane fusion protein, multidrug efflux system